MGSGRGLGGIQGEPGQSEPRAMESLGLGRLSREMGRFREQFLPLELPMAHVSILERSFSLSIQMKMNTRKQNEYLV